MKQFGVGMRVYFKSHVFGENYKPYYDDYRGHIFEVIARPYKEHLELKCVDDPTVIVNGYVHDSDLKLA